MLFLTLKIEISPLPLLRPRNSNFSPSHLVILANFIHPLSMVEAEELWLLPLASRQPCQLHPSPRRGWGWGIVTSPSCILSTLSIPSLPHLLITINSRLYLLVTANALLQPTSIVSALCLAKTLRISGKQGDISSLLQKAYWAENDSDEGASSPFLCGSGAERRGVRGCFKSINLTRNAFLSVQANKSLDLEQSGSHPNPSILKLLHKMSAWDS